MGEASSLLEGAGAGMGVLVDERSNSVKVRGIDKPKAFCVLERRRRKDREGPDQRR